MSDTTTSKKGRTKKSPDEIRAAFRKLTNAVGLEGLTLFVNDKVPEKDPRYGRSVVLAEGSILLDNISGTEMVSICEHASELMRYATKLHTNSAAPAAESRVA
jgi:hypothetical protein